ncbi:MAG: hypothetical protein M3552_06515 [Planctomycetota bacterium]|nr:hypothetical protein [Planctomycetaceae bacterium]MDQ3330289.1 hypothetical protein [Planctomycetota bacterium]
MRSVFSLVFLVFGTIASAVAQEAALQYPLAVVADPDGVIYVADLELPGVWKVTDGKAEVYFQASKRFRTPLNRVRCLAIDGDGRLLAGDSATREVYRFSEDGKPEPLTNGYIGIPSAIVTAEDGTIYVADLEVERVWSFPKDGLKESEEPTEVAVVAGVRGLAFDADKKLLLVTTIEDPIRRVGDDGKLEVLVPGRPFEFPHQIVVGKDGSYLVTDNYAATVWQVPAGGGEPKPFMKGEPLVKPVGLGKRGDDLLVADPHAKAIFVITPDAKVTTLVKAK